MQAAPATAWRATGSFPADMSLTVISIHALREEGDLDRGGSLLPADNISIHALREEGDCVSAKPLTGNCGFLSTPSARRATNADCDCSGDCQFLSTPCGLVVSVAEVYFYPRPPRGGRRCPLVSSSVTIRQHHRRRCSILQFLSTPSARRATQRRSGKKSSLADFYPRPPRGGRREPCGGCPGTADFYPRPPRGGRLLAGIFFFEPTLISIHALREEGD